METTDVFLIFQVIAILAFSAISYIVHKKYKSNTEKLEQYVKTINEIIFVVIIFMVVFGVFALADTYDGLDGFINELYSFDYVGLYAPANPAENDIGFIFINIMALLVIYGINRGKVKSKKTKDSTDWFYDESENINQDNNKE